MSTVRWWAAALAGAQILVGSAATADLIGVKWFAFLVALVGAGQAFLSAYRRDPMPVTVPANSITVPLAAASDPTVIPWPGPVDPEYATKLRAALVERGLTEPDNAPGGAGVTQQSG